MEHTPENTQIKDLRIPQIIEKKLEGATYGQIAKDLQINPKTLYDIRQKQEFQNYINTILPIYNRSILELMESPKDNIKLGATLEYGRMIRAGIPKEIHQRTEKAEVKIVIHDLQP